jgi:uncharacterized protein Yka (UPF0111/DUF47 family)
MGQETGKNANVWAEFQEGLEQGRIEGAKKILQIHLVQLYGQHVDSMQAKLENASLKELEDWANEEALEEAEADAVRRVLLKQLNRRFGKLPDKIQVMMGKATLEMLEEWADYIINARSLVEVFC